MFAVNAHLLQSNMLFPIHEGMKQYAMAQLTFLYSATWYGVGNITITKESKINSFHALLPSIRAKFAFSSQLVCLIICFQRYVKRIYGFSWNFQNRSWYKKGTIGDIMGRSRLLPWYRDIFSLFQRIAGLSTTLRQNMKRFPWNLQEKSVVIKRTIGSI